MKKTIKKYFLYITVFINGAVVLVVEIIGTKLISPLYGSTIYVWSSLIVVTMGALALGYLVGGRLADKFGSEKLLFNLIAYGGVSILLIPKLVNPVLLLSAGLGMKFGPLLSSALIFFIPLFFMGSISPFVVKLQTKNITNVGEESGKIFSIATLGSLFGGLLAGFFLAPLFTSSLLIVLSGLLLILIYIFRQFL